MAILSVKDLTFTYPAKDGDAREMMPALEGVSFSLERGSIVLLCGKSGSGKSTLLRQLKPAIALRGKRSGAVMFEGVEIGDLSAVEQASKIGFVMQSPDSQICTDKVWSELAFGLENIGMLSDFIRIRVAEISSFFGIESWFHRDTFDLSGGEKQILNLASAMALNPDLLVLDEPVAQLDPIACRKFLDLLFHINEELGCTILLATHRLEDMYAKADQIIVLDNGSVFSAGDPLYVAEKLLESENEIKHALPTSVLMVDGIGEGLTEDHTMTGDLPLTVKDARLWLQKAILKNLHDGENERKRESENEYNGECKVGRCLTVSDDGCGIVTGLPCNSEISSSSAVKMKDVCFRYERNTPDVLHGLDMDIPSGVFMGIVGGNGSGKTTILKAIAGSIRPQSGSVKVFGEDPRKQRARYGKDGKALFGYVPQDPAMLFTKQSVAEEIRAAVNSAESLRQGSREGDASLSFDRLSKRFSLDALLDRHPMDLSGGERQLLALALVYPSAPDIFLLDEPTKGLDVCSSHIVSSVLKELAKDGHTVLVTTHDLEFCANNCDVMTMIFDGRTAAMMNPKEFFCMSDLYTTSARRISRGVFECVSTLDGLIRECERCLL